MSNEPKDDFDLATNLEQLIFQSYWISFARIGGHWQDPGLSQQTWPKIFRSKSCLVLVMSLTWLVIPLTMLVIFTVVVLSRVVLVTIPEPAKYIVDQTKDIQTVNKASLNVTICHSVSGLTIDHYHSGHSLVLLKTSQCLLKLWFLLLKGQIL